MYNSFGGYNFSSFSGSRAESQTLLLNSYGGFFFQMTQDPQTWNIHRNKMALHRTLQSCSAPFLLFALELYIPSVVGCSRENQIYQTPTIMNELRVEPKLIA